MDKSNTLRITRWSGLATVLCLACGEPAPVAAQDKKETPKLIAIAPLSISPGSEVQLKLRGLKLDAITAVRFPGVATLKAEIKEKKKADLPNGAEAKTVGDTQCDIVFTAPANLPTGALKIEAVAGMETLAGEIEVTPKALLLEEHEPNNGFDQAQAVGIGQRVAGRIKEERDVDVYSVSGAIGQRVLVEVFASRRGSLADPLITVYDDQRRVIRTVDDTSGRDPAITLNLPDSGKIYVAVQDAHDRGGAWHNYHFAVSEVR